MICVTPNTHVEPFKAIKNDASIMQTIMKKMSEIRFKFHNGDVFVIDRIFRNVKEYL